MIEKKTAMQMINEALSGKVSPDKLVHLQTVIIPSVLMDFYKMVSNASSGALVSEEYHLDDKSLVISLFGKNEGGVPEIVSADVRNGTK